MGNRENTIERRITNHEIGKTMKLDLAHAEPMGSLIIEGTHQPFHALACALRPASVRIGRKSTVR